jgi:hypothetical protein
MKKNDNFLLKIIILNIKLKYYKTILFLLFKQ